MILALVALRVVTAYEFFSAPNVTYDKEQSRILTERNFRQVDYYTVNWPYKRVLVSAEQELSDDQWTKVDHSVAGVDSLFFDKGDWEISYYKPENEPLAKLSVYPSTPWGRAMADARLEFVSWLEDHARESGFRVLGLDNDDNTILFPFGVSDTLFYIGGGHVAPFRLYRFDKGHSEPTWSVDLGPYKGGKKSELVGTLRRYLANANGAHNTGRKEMIVSPVSATAKRDLDASFRLVHVYHHHMGDTIQGGYIEPNGLAHYINFWVVGREYQSPWEEENKYAGQ
ncbi:MAG: hypothetical protein JST12_10005 [Armatimonadetes bacterium]|nr:hypothetical protein [Armatimonadota bacterium]